MKLRITNSPIAKIVVAAVLLAALNTLAFAASGTWTSTASLRNARDGHTATLLPNIMWWSQAAKTTREPMLPPKSTVR